MGLQSALASEISEKIAIGVENEPSITESDSRVVSCLLLVGK